MRLTKKIVSCICVIVLCVCLFGIMHCETVRAEEIKISMEGFEITFYDDGGGMGSLWITKYTGTATEVTLPTEINYNGKTYKGAGCIGEGAFAGNSTVKKVIVPSGYEAISSNAFKGCKNLEEIVIAGEEDEYGYYISHDAFSDCPNLKTYRIGIKKIAGGTNINYGIGTDNSGNVYPSVTVYTIKGSDVDTYIKDINNGSTGNKITIKYEEDPAKEANIKKVIPSDNSKKDDSDNTNNNTNNNSNNGASSTFVPGASFENTDKAITSFASESDPKGSLYAGLQLKGTKVSKTSIKLQWKKVKNATKYVIYGNNCKKTNKYNKLTEAGGSSIKITKIGNEKIKKGKYYKFIVIAVDKDNKVVSTSKTVHIATKGGKVGNDKKIKLKKSKVKIKVKKSFKIKAKLKPVSKKLKVKRHKKMQYESTNEAVATVNSKGVVKAKKKGSCIVYAYTQNGVSAKLKVTVK